MGIIIPSICIILLSVWVGLLIGAIADGVRNNNILDTDGTIQTILNLNVFQIILGLFPFIVFLVVQIFLKTMTYKPFKK